ncbi:MAG TPA: hypothetical protein VFH58_14130 [Acidimicrobiales bacterium]|nr:hypothetical protein [Acidimicrobiales bacterium]
MSRELGDGPEDWSAYQRYPADPRSDLRWAFLPLALLRGIITWVTGKDPVAESRHRRLARDQAEGAAKYEAIERSAYEHLGGSRDTQRPPEGGAAEVNTRS